MAQTAPKCIEERFGGLATFVETPGQVVAVLSAVKAPKDRDPEGFLAGLLLAVRFDGFVVLRRLTVRGLSGGAIRVGLGGAVALRGAGGGR